jgi:hypothetical protein
MHSQPGQPRRGGGRRVGGGGSEGSDGTVGPGVAPPGSAPSGHAEALRQYLDGLRLRAQGAASWLGSSSQYAQLINRDGFVPVTARFSAEDLAFLASAREELLRFTELGLRLAELHQPQEASAIASDPAGQFHRCGSCMWRWPCPTFRILDDVLSSGLLPGDTEAT